MKNVVNRALVAEKKNYIQPAFEVLTVNATYGLCQAVSQFGNFNYGGDTDTIDPSMGG